MQFDWENWNIGGRIIFVSACVACFSMFMNWWDIGIASQTGLSQGAVVYLALYIYPVYSLFKKQTINRFWGLACAIGAVAVTLEYINSKSGEILGKKFNAAGAGATLFLLASIALIVGVIKYSAPEAAAAPAPPEAAPTPAEAPQSVEAEAPEEDE